MREMSGISGRKDIFLKLHSMVFCLYHRVNLLLVIWLFSLLLVQLILNRDYTSII